MTSSDNDGDNNDDVAGEQTVLEIGDIVYLGIIIYVQLHIS